eukprot:COSAG01_NODE_17422_length_1152_cov_3.803419_1_plen_45_part_00
MLGIEPRGCTLSGLTPVQRAELEDRREKWSEDLIDVVAVVDRSR